MIRPSPELLAVARRWYRAIRERDGATMRNLLSESEHLRFMGTARDELWSGQVVREGVVDHYNEMPAVLKSEELHAEAFESGEIGWALFDGLHYFEGLAEPRQIRATLIFAIESGSWKIIQRHTSIPIPNQQVFGYEHKAFDALVAAAREGFKVDQTEGMATIMFTDIANSSRLAEALGDRIWAGAVRAHLDLVAEIIRENGGQLVKSLGDGTMSSFSSAASALRAATQIQRRNRATGREPRLRVRIGVHSGDVIQTADDFFGTVVNKAARIASAAGPGEILASDATRLMAGPDRFAFETGQTAALRGLPGDHLVHHLAWRT